MKTKKCPTQSQIARAVGVSQAAVSAILSGSSTLSVSDDTRWRILSAAEEMGYVARRPNARTADNAQRTVLLVGQMPLVECGDSAVSEAYAVLKGQIATDLSQSLTRHGIGMSVHHLGSNAGAFMQWLSDSDVSGIIWNSSDVNHSLLHWVATRYPLVLLDRYWKNNVPCDFVGIDQGRNITLAGEHLWEAGHRRIATFGHCRSNSIFKRRIDGYKWFVQEKGIRDYSEFQDLCDDQDYSAVQKVEDILNLWLKLGREAPTALILSDVFALRLLGAARGKGIDIPGDLSVVGIDNTSPCRVVDPALSSMDIPFTDMCGEAVDMLARRMANRHVPARTVFISPRLIARHSVRRLEAEPTPGRPK